MRNEAGFTLVELMVSTMIGMLTLGVTLMILQVTSQGSERVVGQVEANQRIRPPMRTIVDELHSACVSPGLAPVLAGSTEDSLSFLHAEGSSVAPTPDRVLLTYSSNTLTRSRYAATGGSAPNWTFGPTPYETRQVIDRIRPAYLGNPGAIVPVFRYFAYQGGSLDPNPLPTPLSAADAAKTVQVSVAFASGSISTAEISALNPVSVSNDISLRFTPASEGVSVENLPCA
ncbi:MAG: prepilin-type N-terminal cleavage/methylation domain-containing protein [Solirubrobacterales bacterium]